mmetsp:Transcript_2853/g.6650  ORF Transcript_2853/g.6650 Transcript_2853/m.6650 type:complete len:155 (+) Transcript_2853:188-652(+)
MRVLVRLGQAKAFEVEADSQAAVFEALEARAGLPAGASAKLELSAGCGVLTDAPFAEQGVKNGATLSIGARALGGMQIFIKTLTGRKTPFNFEKDVKVIEVKHALQEKEGIQVDQIRLIFSGKQLADDKLLGDYNVSAGAVIHMVLQLRGGSSC